VRGGGACHDVVVAATHARRGAAPLLVLSGVVVLVVWGLGRGVWLSNLHNGVLGMAFAFVGAYVLFQRPGHREGLLFMAAGTVEAVIFLGRQLGHFTPQGTRSGIWWGWLGVWPVAVGLALTTLSVLLFPDGRLPSPRWRWVVIAVVTVAGGCAVLSALWPVEYASTGVTTQHPLGIRGGDAAAAVWGALAHPAYAVFQLLWVPAVILRWRNSGRLVRAQLTWVTLAACLSAASLLAGLLLAGTPRLGLLTAGLVPIAAGWAIVHGQHLAAYSGLSWLSRAGTVVQDLPAGLARAIAEALAAPWAVVRIGDEDALEVVGVWPENSDRDGPVSLASLRQTPDLLTRSVLRDGTVIGAISLARPAGDPLSLAQERLVDDLAAQAVLVIEHLALARAAARQRIPDNLTQLSPRERQVLELMARGLSNAAICQELHLSIKTVEPIISAIFTKLGLDPDSANNRRVLAVLAFLRA
jgi:DNA-binding CsgD family transcriptional regulator